MTGDKRRQQMVDELETGIKEAKRKVENGRVRDAENEKIRLEWLQTLNNLVETKRRVLEKEGGDYE